MFFLKKVLCIYGVKKADVRRFGQYRCGANLFPDRLMKSIKTGNYQISEKQKSGQSGQYKIISKELKFPGKTGIQSRFCKKQ